MESEGPTATRRDVLRAGGAVAAGAAGFFAMASAVQPDAVAEAAVAPELTRHIPTTITLELNGVAVERVRAVSRAGLSVSVETDQTSAGRTIVRGTSLPPQVAVTREFDGTTTFQSWFAGTPSSTGAPAQALKQTAVLTLLGRRGSMISRVTLDNAWPIAYDVATWTVPSNTAARLTETVTLVADAATFE